MAFGLKAPTPSSQGPTPERPRDGAGPGRHHTTPPLPWLKEATSSGVCPAWKATGNSTLVEARPPRPVPSSWAAVPPPPSSAARAASRSKGQRSGRPCGLPAGSAGPRMSQAPLPSQAGVRLLPTAPAGMPQPLSGSRCSLPPSTTSLCGPAHWLPGKRTRGKCPSQEATKLARPKDSMVHQPGAQVGKEMPTAHQPASSAEELLAAQRLVSQRPCARACPPAFTDSCPRLTRWGYSSGLSTTARSHLSAGRSGAWGS